MTTKVQGPRKPVKLTARDWEEISAALYVRAHQIEEQGPDDIVGPRDHQDWLTHLREIRGKIGPDAKFAKEAGVAPVKR